MDEVAPLLDWLCAACENTRWSTREIEPFIRRYHIDMSEFEPMEYRSFAQFFGRRFQPGARKFPEAPSGIGAFAETPYFAWERWEAEQNFPVKGRSLHPDEMLGSSKRSLDGEPTCIGTSRTFSSKTSGA